MYIDRSMSSGCHDNSAFIPYRFYINVSVYSMFNVRINERKIKQKRFTVYSTDRTEGIFFLPGGGAKSPSWLRLGDVPGLSH